MSKIIRRKSFNLNSYTNNKILLFLFDFYSKETLRLEFKNLGIYSHYLELQDYGNHSFNNELFKKDFFKMFRMHSKKNMTKIVEQLIMQISQFYPLSQFICYIGL